MLLTKEIRKQLPPLYANEHKKPEDVRVIAKFFTPDSSWTWYATEGEKQGDDFLFFGFVRGLENELGYFTLRDLETATGHLGLHIERDKWFGKHTLAEVMEKQI